MVAIGFATQNRLLDAAKQHLGSSGGEFLRDIVKDTHGVPLDQATYQQMETVWPVLRERGAVMFGREPAARMAATLYQLQQSERPPLSNRLFEIARRHLGAAAEPMLNNLASHIGILVSELDDETLPLLIDAVREEGGSMLGEDTAQRLAGDLSRPRPARSPGLALKIVAAAEQHFGSEGEAIISRLCRQGLEVNLSDLEPDALPMLAKIVERDGPGLIGEPKIAAFLQAARRGLASPAKPLRQQIVRTVARAVGPAAEEFLIEVCSRHGMPFEAVDMDHTLWLAEVLRAEAAPIAGKKAADDIARDVRGFLTTVK